MNDTSIDTPEKLDAYTRGFHDGIELAKAESGTMVDKMLGFALMVGTGLGCILTIILAPLVQSLVA